MEFEATGIWFASYRASWDRLGLVAYRTCRSVGAEYDAATNRVPVKYKPKNIVQWLSSPEWKWKWGYFNTVQIIMSMCSLMMYYYMNLVWYSIICLGAPRMHCAPCIMEWGPQNAMILYKHSSIFVSAPQHSLFSLRTTAIQYPFPCNMTATKTRPPRRPPRRPLPPPLPIE